MLLNTLVLLVALAATSTNSSGKRLRATGKSNQDASVSAPVRNDLNETSPSLGSASRIQTEDSIQAAAIISKRDARQNLPNSSAAATSGSQSASVSSARSRWRQMDQSLSKSLTTASSDLRRQMDEIQLVLTQQGRQVSPSCRHSIDSLVKGLHDQELWAVRMMDASAASRGLPSGLLEGTLTDLGHFDQCLAIGRESGAPTSGQYCSVLVRPQLPTRPRLHTVCRRMPELGFVLNATHLKGPNPIVRLLSQQSHQFLYAGLRLGLCLPASCTQAEVERLVRAHLARFELNGQVKNCQRAHRENAKPTNGTIEKTIDDSLLKSLPISQSILQNFDLPQQTILLVYLMLVVLILLGTWLDAGRIRQAPINNNTHLTGVFISGCAANQAVPRKLCDCKRCQAQHQRGENRSYSMSGCTSAGNFATTGSEQARGLPMGQVQLGPQKNPLVRFTAGTGTISPPSSDESDDLRLRRHMTTSAIPPELLPIYQEVDSTGSPAKSSLPRRLLICFSLRRNLRSICRLSPRIERSGTSKPLAGSAEGMSDIKVIHGLRTISMIWIIFGHTIGLVVPEMMTMLNTTLAVDTFFMISGLVTIVSFARKCRSASLILSGRNSATEEDKKETRHGVRQRSGLMCLADDSHLEVTSVTSDSSSTANSNVSSVDSSASSSAKCADLSSKSSSQKNFILNKQLKSADFSQNRVSDWPSDFKPLTWLVMRYLRLTPAYAAIISLAILMPALGSGPFWPETVGQMGEACRVNWWTNLLYVNNFVATDNLCLIHSWYLSNEWQFFLVALCLFGLAYKSRKLALILMVGLFVGSSAATFIATVENDFPPTIVTTSPAVAERWQFIYSLYYKPWPHLPSYLIGVLVGCLILRVQVASGGAASWTQKSSVWLNLTSGTRLLCWLLSSLIAVAVLNSIYPWNMGIEVDPILAGLHSATFRTLWAASNGWLVFALVTRPKNPLALILGWHGFHVPSRLTYCAYLVHPLVIYYHFGMLRERIDSSVYGQLHRFMGTLLMSYLLAFVLSLCLEGPFIQLQKLLSRSMQVKPSEKKPADVKVPRQRRRAHRCKSRDATKHVLVSPQGSASSEDSMLQLKLTRNQATGQFSVEPVECLHTVSDQLTGCYPPDLEHNTGSSSTDLHATSCAHYELTPSNQNLGVDEEFQKKLAQAIGRGFRIRSKIVNGTSKKTSLGGQSRGHSRPIRVGHLTPSRTDFAPMFSPDNPKQWRRSQPMQDTEFGSSRRSAPFSTFVSSAAQIEPKSDQESNTRRF